MMFPIFDKIYKMSTKNSRFTVKIGKAKQYFRLSYLLCEGF